MNQQLVERPTIGKPITADEVRTQLQFFSSDTIRAEQKRKSLRKKLLTGLAIVVFKVGGIYLLYDYFVSSRYVTTDNAYVAADIAHVTPLIAGPVTDVRVTDTQAVKRGDVLVVLDDTDARLAVAEAEAALGQAERRVKNYFANDKGLAAQVAARAAEQMRASAQIAAAESELSRARVDLDRRKALAASGSVSGEELTVAENAFAQAQAALEASHAAEVQAAATKDAAVGSLRANAVYIQDTTIDTNPEVAAARARLEQAQVNLERTVIRAPIDGVVTQREVHIGQRVQPGAALMSVVPVDEAYVNANFKEGQLTEVRNGQMVKLTSDLYGSGVVFHGRVVGLSGGTGSALALIPAQNATGNWIKVVQRVPVRVTLDAVDLQRHPLRVGLSMVATIDTHH